MDHKERALVQRIQAGDTVAFRELVEQNKQCVYYLALDLTGNHYDAEDISQEVFIKAFRGIDKFRSGAKVNTWLYRITMNTFIDKKRKKTLKVVEMPAGDEEEGTVSALDLVADDVTGNPERGLSASKIGRHIDEALSSLSEQERAVFVMRHYDELTLKEVAEALGIAEGTVKSLLFRSIRKLRRLLSFYQEELGLEDSV
jgi:RNA polymerase sigma-70 factor (ECF subfamily)